MGSMERISVGVLGSRGVGASLIQLKNCLAHFLSVRYPHVLLVSRRRMHGMANGNLNSSPRRNGKGRNGHLHSIVISATRRLPRLHQSKLLNACTLSSSSIQFLGSYSVLHFTIVHCGSSATSTCVFEESGILQRIRGATPQAQHEFPFPDATQPLDEPC